MEYQYQNMPFKIIVGMRRLQDFESFWSSDFQGILSIPAFADTIREVWKALSINIQNIKRRREINKLSVLTASLLVVSKPDNWDDGHSHKWRGTRSPSPSPWSSRSPSSQSSLSHHHDYRGVQGGVRHLRPHRGGLHHALLRQYMPPGYPSFSYCLLEIAVQKNKTS